MEGEVKASISINKSKLYAPWAIPDSFGKSGRADSSSDRTLSNPPVCRQATVTFRMMKV